MSPLNFPSNYTVYLWKIDKGFKIIFVIISLKMSLIGHGCNAQFFYSKICIFPVLNRSFWATFVQRKTLTLLLYVFLISFKYLHTYINLHLSFYVKKIEEVHVITFAFFFVFSCSDNNFCNYFIVFFFAI